MAALAAIFFYNLPDFVEQDVILLYAKIARSPHA
jgi:hypothetical protein